MPNDPRPRIAVWYTLEFKRNLRHLAKEYPNIRTDLSRLLVALENGVREGDKIPGVGHDFYKARAKNTDARKGKSGGYRLIYLVRSATDFVLATVYSKSDQGDIAAKTIQRIIDEYDKRKG